jgi:hypothetical protein
MSEGRAYDIGRAVGLGPRSPTQAKTRLEWATQVFLQRAGTLPHHYSPVKGLVSFGLAVVGSAGFTSASRAAVCPVPLSTR